jgi:hypothetical protein
MSFGPMNYPILMKSNYNQWSLLMKIKLEAHSLWGAVKPGGSEFQLDRMALDAIYSAVLPKIIVVLVTKETKDMMMEACESIKTTWISDDRIRMASTLKVRHRYEMLHDSEEIKDFAMWFIGTVN